MESILERFISYTSIDTESEYNPVTLPSTEKQKNLGKLLVKQLKEMGFKNAEMSANACVYGTLPANYENCKAPVIGFSSHLDTTPECSGKDVKAKVTKNYDGKDIILNVEKNIVMDADKFDHLKNYIGQDIVTSDGTTLLGADDKAGLAEIMDMIQYFYKNPDVKHGEIQVFFPCDEEVGCFGTKAFDKTKFTPDFAYTLDGGAIGEITYETFNASEANVKFKGINIHPGISKNQMINSILIAKEFLDMLPDAETPGHTELREGYYHAISFQGEVEESNIRFYIRDHDKTKFLKREKRFYEIADYLNSVYGEGTVEVVIKETYKNMGEFITPHFEIVEAIKSSMKSLGVDPYYFPMRGGTDGAILSAEGIPCPNICTGGHNFHGRYEYVPVESMEKISQILSGIVKIFVK